MERNLVLESCLMSDSWGLLEMYVLLTDDRVEFDPYSTNWILDSKHRRMKREQFFSAVQAVDIKLDYKEHKELFLTLLAARCSVSRSRYFKSPKRIRITIKFEILIEIISYPLTPSWN